MIKFAKILKKYYQDFEVVHLIECWKEPHRQWHNINHLIEILSKIDKCKSLSQEEYDILVITAFFHDVVYDPKNRDNEIKSIELFKEYSKNLPVEYYKSIIDIIKCTAFYPEKPKDKLQLLFWEMDNDPVINCNFYQFIDYEDRIRKEYSFIETSVYKENRIKFLQKYIGLVDEDVDEYIKKCVDYVSNLY